MSTKHGDLRRGEKFVSRRVKQIARLVYRRAAACVLAVLADSARLTRLLLRSDLLRV